jgi:hypothetical protein
MLQKQRPVPTLDGTGRSLVAAEMRITACERIHSVAGEMHQMPLGQAVLHRFGEQTRFRLKGPRI